MVVQECCEVEVCEIQVEMDCFDEEIYFVLSGVEDGVFVVVFESLFMDLQIEFEEFFEFFFLMLCLVMEKFREIEEIC